jgi:twitching motility protein PilT
MVIDLTDLLANIVKMGASDLHITVGLPPMARVNGEMVRIGEDILMPEDTEALVEEMLTEEEMRKYRKDGEVDLAISRANIGRFRVNAFTQRSLSAIVLRTIPFRVPQIDELGLPDILKEVARKQRGLFLVTGPTGSGKSTTLASIIDLINTERDGHILTLEDPIEYLHTHKKSVVNQREVGMDTKGYGPGLRAALREDPDVILVGEMRDLETISTALTAAETGHLVFSTLHTIGAAKSIDRIIDVFPTHQQDQVRIQLSSVLIGILSQALIKRSDTNKRVAVFELMVANPAIKNLIREKKGHQILSVMQTSSNVGMLTIDNELLKLYKKQMISKESVLSYCYDIDYVKQSLF